MVGASVACALAAVSLVAVQLLRPLPAIAPTVFLTGSVRLGTPAAIPWPASGAAAVVVDGLGSLGASGTSAPRPMASTAKIMTALLTLEDHPVPLGQVGPSIAVTPADVANYQRELRLGESVVRVAAGEQLSEYQLLQGLMLPSASNFADILATWDAGSSSAFVGRMNVRAGALAMAQTHYADASGFSPQTVSVPTDLIRLARTAMAIPVFKQIVGQSQATLPVAGVVRNLDTLLGKVLRMNLDGSPAAGNPFPGSNPYVYAYGFRDPQGIAWDSSGQLYGTDHGPVSNDEVNIIFAGKNYGWPTCVGICNNPSFVDPVRLFSGEGS